MNLKEFLEYRTICPICDSQLTTFLHSQKRQSVIHEDGRLVFQFRMDELKKQLGFKKQDAKCRVGYSFGIHDNSWQMEVYQEGKRLDNYTTTRLMDRFKELDKNLSSYKFYRQCTAPNCHCFNYATNSFKLGYHNGKIDTLTSAPGGLTINTEYFGMTLPQGKGFKVYKLLNEYTRNRSVLIYGKHLDKHIARDDWGQHNPPIQSMDMLDTGIIHFSTKDEMINRIQRLLLFS